MAKADSEAQEVIQAAPVVQAAPVSTLTEFCARLSSTDNRTELIGAFFRMETAAGRVKATDTEFQKNYSDFCNKPA